MLKRPVFKPSSSPDIRRRERLIVSVRLSKQRRAVGWSRCVTRDPLASRGRQVRSRENE
jgi:hypothetical protein